jgi:hypothetical protein
MGHFLLVAIINASVANPMSGITLAGYQSSTVQRFESLEQCKTAAKHLTETYKNAQPRNMKVDKGSMRCVDLDSGKFEEVSI